MVYGSDPRGFKHFPELRTRWVRAIDGPHSSPTCTFPRFSIEFPRVGISGTLGLWNFTPHRDAREFGFHFRAAGRSVQLLIAEFQGWINFYRLPRKVFVLEKLGVWIFSIDFQRFPVCPNWRQTFQVLQNRSLSIFFQNHSSIVRLEEIISIYSLNSSVKEEFFTFRGATIWNISRHRDHYLSWHERIVKFSSNLVAHCNGSGGILGRGRHGSPEIML